MLTPSLFDDPSTRWIEPTAFTRKPRAYQVKALEAWRAQRGAARGHLLCLFTGGGKTFLAGQIAREEPGRVLFLVNRENLGQQSIKSLERDTGRAWELEQAESYASVNGTAHVVALVQTISQLRRHQRFGPDAFSLIIVDEAHRMTGEKYRTPINYFTGAKILAMTATPRGAKRGLGRIGITNDQLFNYPLSLALRESWATPFDFRPFETDVKLNLDKVKWTNGDFQLGMLDEAIAEIAAPIAKAAVEQCGTLRTLAFCPGVKATIATAEAINALRPGAAMPLYGALDSHRGAGIKTATIAAHKRGEFQFLVSCDMIREGYDDEYVQCLLIAKPMGKPHDFEQVVGRVSRIWPGIGDLETAAERKAAIAASPKPRGLVIDLACVSLKHKLADPIDLLGSDYSQQERDRARKKLKDKGGDPAALLDEAREFFRRRAQVAAAAAAARSKLKPVSREPQTPSGDTQATPGQRRHMEAFGIPWDEHTTKLQAQKAIAWEYVARKKGASWCANRKAGARCTCGACWCDYRQRQFLTQHVGLRDAKTVTVAKGRHLIAAYKAVGKRRLTPDEIIAALS